MIRTLLAAALLAAVPAAYAADAAPADVPKPQCEPKPRAPGPAMRGEEMVMNRFKRDVKRYQDCMKEYIDGRKAAMQANEKAANDAVEDYNATMKQINADLQSD